jgi:hypothetical protein
VFWTAKVQPKRGMRRRRVEKVTRCLVPRMGGRKVQTMRKVPPARPGMAVSQKSWVEVRSNPTLGRRTTRALTTNQVMKARVRLKVVIQRVRQARRASQRLGSSGFHSESQVPRAIFSMGGLL